MQGPALARSLTASYPLLAGTVESTEALRVAHRGVGRGRRPVGVRHQLTYGMSCSQCRGIEEQFGDASTKRSLRRLHRRGPDRTTRLLILAVRDVLQQCRVERPVLLDVGAGIGALHHELLDAGVHRAVHVDASSAHLDVARAETARRGHSERVVFLQGDFVSMAGTIEPAELVTLDRVICCYHDMERLVTLSAEKSTCIYGAVYPRRTPWMPVMFGIMNLILRLKRSTFRVFLHDPRAIDVVLRRAGLELRSLQRTLSWEVVVYERRAAAG